LNYLYSLYDALVSINVPSDKARAVVDAMERDMGSTLATKQDLEFHTLATKKDIEILKQDMDDRFARVDQRFDTLELRMTVKLGSMLAVCFGLVIAALRFWN